ncbi:hypothetical protein B9Z39_09195 [Limnohabitans sp. JirII-29]|nr:hypothetical protein B9Z39_09195 [Limnohabitans sp. JirII-29]
MSRSWVGKCIVQRSATGKMIQTSRIIHVDLAQELVIHVPFPKSLGKRLANYVPAPRAISAIGLAKALENSEKCELVDFKTPEHWLWTDAQLESELESNPIRRHRRKLGKWKEVRDRSYELIQPFVERCTVQEILEHPDLQSWPAQRAQELGLKSGIKIRRALQAYLLGLGDKRALMPGYANCGAPGQQKFSTKDTGRPTIAARMLGEKKHKPNLSPEARAKLALGWQRHKTKGVSDRVALAKTLNDYFVKSVTPSGQGIKVELLPEAFDISQAMFAYWGLRSQQTLRSIELNRGLLPSRDETLRRMHKARDRYDTLNGVAYIDSTSTDQTLISSIHPLKRLKSPWRTEVLGASIDYIFGIYVGFEAASATTALLAILSAATDKVDMCARFGHIIEPRDWYGSTFNMFEADNGEAKNKLTMYTLQELSTSASYGKVYDAINKAPNESGHHQRQKRNDHLLPGTTMGRTKIRGEANRIEAAGLRFEDYMHLLIGEILRHNNEEYLDPPRIEMYPKIKERTRRGVVEWMIDHHYLSSSPMDIDVLRVTCLPRFEASMHTDGIHLFVPGSGGKRLIRRLVYRSDYLLLQGLLHQSRRKVGRLLVHMNPMDLSHIWANIDGLKRFDLATGDQDFEGVTLMDWLAISEDDRLARFLANRFEKQHLADKLANVENRYKVGKRAQQQAIKTHGKLTKTGMKRDVRAMTEMEKAILTGVPVKQSLPWESQEADKAEKLLSEPQMVPQTQPNSSNDLWLDIAAQIYENHSGGPNG